MTVLNNKSLIRSIGGAMLLLCVVAEVRADSSSERIDPREYVPFPQLLPQPASAGSSNDPIGPIADHMKDVVGDLNQMKTDVPVQDKQKQVVGSLDGVIKQLEQECKGNGGGNPNPSKPMSRSVIAKGPGGSGPLHDAQAGTRVWGQLPPKEREKILQSQTEGFPAGYESVLANYYSRLAQEQVAGENTAGPTTQPVAP
jgi:hypothetical protein